MNPVLTSLPSKNRLRTRYHFTSATFQICTHTRFFYGSGLAGTGVISRFPIRDDVLGYFASERPYLMADLAIGGRILSIISAHPLVIMGPGAAQAPGRADYAMMAEVAVKRGNTILAGDLNLTDQNEGYAEIMERGLIDAHRATGVGFGPTFPRRLPSGWSAPMIRIDYILMTEEFQPIASWVGGDGGSDHLPVLATLGWGDDA